MKKIFYSIALALGLVAMTGCDLTERNYSNIDASVYYQNENSVKGAVAAIYNEAATGFCEYFYYLQEFPADQIAWRSWNGSLWGWDEGLKFVLSSQTWTPEATIVLQAWEKAWKTIGLCNQLMADLEKVDIAKMNMSEAALNSYIAEVRTLRAWAYYNNFELWGGALPLCTTVSSEVPGSISDNFEEGCQKMFDFIHGELEAAYPDLQNHGALRVSPAMNRMIKMRLLLNSEVFTGVARYKECKQLIEQMRHDFPNYTIVPDYREIFSVGNENCPEVVFAFAEANGQLNTGWMRNVPFLSYAYKEIYDPFATNQSGWNCIILAPSYDNSGDETVYPAMDNTGGVNKYPAGGMYGGTDNPKNFVKDYGDKLGAVSARFEPTDIRRQDYKFDENGWNGGVFVTGLQRDIHNDTIIAGDADRKMQPLIYIDQLGQFAGAKADGTAIPLEDVQSPRWGQTNSGYRMIKYPLYTAASGIDYQSISEVEFRWAEVEYTYAECLMRLNESGDEGDWKAYVDKVRRRYFTGTMTDMAASWTNEERMLHQWGIEFLNEGRRRRTDLRRFDKFTQGQWWFFGRAKDDSGVIFPAQRSRKYEWYPLPASALTVNPGLKQNPNY